MFCRWLMRRNYFQGAGKPVPNLGNFREYAICFRKMRETLNGLGRLKNYYQGIMEYLTTSEIIANHECDTQKQGK